MKMNCHSTKDYFLIMAMDQNQSLLHGMLYMLEEKKDVQTVVSEADILQAYKRHDTQNNYGKPNGK